MQIRSSRLGPGDGHLPVVGVETEGLPNRRRAVDDVAGARRLEVVLVVAPVQRVALVHHLGRDGPAVPGPDHDAPPAPAAFGEPARGQRDHPLAVAEERARAAGRAAAVPVVGEAVERERGAGAAPARDDGRGAREGGVAPPVLAAHGVVLGVAAAGPAADGAAGLAGRRLEERAVGVGGGES